MTSTLQDCRELDAQDPLRALREQFILPAGVIYLDGNSLGPLPKTTAARVNEAITQEWGQGLIRAWNSAGWIDAPQRVGDKTSLEQHVAAWEQRRNAAQVKANWQFTTKDARIKLRKLYPTINASRCTRPEQPAD